MFDDRQYLIVPYAECPLIERLLLGNRARKHPYDFWFLDERTIASHIPNLDAIKIVAKSAWAFYMPAKDCPLNYRELSLWFVLYSIGNEKGQCFQQSFNGLEKLTGLGEEQASVLSDKLVSLKLIEVERSGKHRYPWFFLHKT